jgi:SAM-dependent methyltransferase
MVIRALRDRLAGASELMDAEPADPRELAGALEGLEWINRRLGGRRKVLAELQSLLEGARPPARILDVASGFADLPRAIVLWARRRGLAVAIDCLDCSPAILELARRASASFPELRFLPGDATDLPCADGSYDVALASLVLHHLEGDGPVRLLKEMWRVARRGAIASDLRRGPWPYLVTWLFLRAAFRNRLILADGPLSVRRSYTPREALALAGRAGWKSPRVARHAFFRMALVGDKRTGQPRG